MKILFNFFITVLKVLLCQFLPYKNDFLYLLQLEPYAINKIFIKSFIGVFDSEIVPKILKLRQKIYFIDENLLLRQKMYYIKI